MRIYLGEGKGRNVKTEALLFQSTIDIHIQNAHKTHKNAEIRINFERSAGPIAKNKNEYRKKQDIWADQTLTTSGRKKTEKTTNFQFFRDNFFLFKRDIMPSKL